MTALPPPEVPADLAAAVDRTRAELTALVRTAREHHQADVCHLNRDCAGHAVNAVLEEMDAAELHSLLYMAVAELATVGYGLPGRDDLTVLAGLDWPHDPGAGDGDR